jgi:hypothetical protein
MPKFNIKKIRRYINKELSFVTSVEIKNNSLKINTLKKKDLFISLEGLDPFDDKLNSLIVQKINELCS